MVGKAKLGLLLLVPTVAALLVLLGGRAATSQGVTASQGTIELVNHLEGAASGAMAVQGNYTYMAFENKLVVIDTSSPATPRRVGSLFMPGAIWEIEASGSHLYLTVEGGVLYRVNVADPAQPVIDWLLRGEGSYSSLASDERYVYVSRSPALITNDFFVDILDISSSISPIVVGSYATSGIFWLAVRGEYLYLSTSAGLEIVSLADPANPTRVGFYPEPEGMQLGEGVLVGENLYFLGFYEFCGRAGCYRDYYLMVLDVSNPATPAERSRGELRSVQSIAPILLVAGDHAYIVDHGFLHSALIILDISDPATPKQLQSYLWSIVSGRLVGSHLYLAGAEGLQIFDTTNPSQLNEMGRYRTFGTPRDLTVADDRLYLSSSVSDLLLLDLTTPANPVEVGRYNDPDGYPLRITADGSEVYLFWYESLGSSDEYSLRVVDASTPLSPTLTGIATLSKTLPPISSAELELSGNSLYLLWGSTYLPWQGGLITFDVTMPTSPTQVAEFTKPYPLYDLVVKEPYAYILSMGPQWSTSAFSIYDFSRPMTPTEIISYTSPVPLTGLAMTNSYAYLGGERLETWAIQDGAAATQIDTTETNWGDIPWDSLVKGPHLYVASGDFKVFDLSTPSQPTSMSLPQYLSSSATKVVSQGDFVYGAASNGLFVFQYRPPLFEVSSRLYLPISQR